MRVSEIVNLRVKDFAFEQGYGWVRQGKGRKDRLFVIPQRLKKQLKKWILTEELEAEDWLFSGQQGDHYSIASLQMIVKAAKKKAKIMKEVHPHTFRHSFATHLIQNGYAVTEVQPLMGRNKLETTMVYLHMASLSLLNVKSPLDSLGDKA